MIRADQIPDEVVEAAARAIANDAEWNWDDVPYAHDVIRSEARAAIAAALNAWPGAMLDCWAHYDGALLLPLPQEGGAE
jgi:hypothetical protein